MSITLMPVIAFAKDKVQFDSVRYINRKALIPCGFCLLKAALYYMYGGPGGFRTRDRRISNPLFYPLNYRPLGANLLRGGGVVPPTYPATDQALLMTMRHIALSPFYNLGLIGPGVRSAGVFRSALWNEIPVMPITTNNAVLR